MARFNDLTGQTFGRLTVLGCVPRQDRPVRRAVYWFCLCECGRKTTVQAGSLRSGNTKSCGCLSGSGGPGVAVDHAFATNNELRRIAEALEDLVAALRPKVTVSQSEIPA